MTKNSSSLLALNSESKEETKALNETLKQESSQHVDFTSSLTMDYFSGIGILLFMLFGLYFILWTMRKYGKGKFIPLASSITRDELRVEARLPLDVKKTLYVVKYKDKHLLIGGTEQSLSLLSSDNCFDDDIKKAMTKADFEKNVQEFNDTMNKE